MTKLSDDALEAAAKVAETWNTRKDSIYCQDKWYKDGRFYDSLTVPKNDEGGEPSVAAAFEDMITGHEALVALSWICNRFAEHIDNGRGEHPAKLFRQAKSAPAT